MRNASYASKQNKHAGTNKQSYIKARPLRKHSEYLLFFSLSLKSLNNLQHNNVIKTVPHIHKSTSEKVFTNIKSKIIFV